MPLHLCSPAEIKRVPESELVRHMPNHAAGLTECLCDGRESPTTATDLFLPPLLFFFCRALLLAVAANTRHIDTTLPPRLLDLCSLGLEWISARVHLLLSSLRLLRSIDFVSFSQDTSRNRLPGDNYLLSPCRTSRVTRPPFCSGRGARIVGGVKRSKVTHTGNT